MTFGRLNDNWNTLLVLNTKNIPIKRYTTRRLSYFYRHTSRLSYTVTVYYEKIIVIQKIKY